MIEAQLDGLLAPSHHYGALSFGNKASMSHQGHGSNPRAAAHQAIDKMQCVLQCGGTQLVLPPLYRPDFDFLRSAGFNGNKQELLSSCASEAPHLLSMAQSCAFTWAANCATCIPSSDSDDHKFHFIPANLVSTDHRALEGSARTTMLRAIFSNQDYFTVHDPLPMSPALADEGAANHHRLHNKDTGDFCHIFVHGKAHGMPQNLGAKKFPARQSKEAQASIIRLAKIRNGHSLLVTQDPRAIDAGAFHNDVVFAGSGQR
ncbi:MAG: N-succinylarginine dihydrolase, partial [Planctomycetes bacterium]|nr:N-succinylarginine dihydrolase [Planctomycetota bacterium]